MGKVSLGRLVRGISEDTSKTFSIVDEINKACSSGMTEVGCFSIIALKRACKSMLECLDDFDRDKFFIEFFKFYQLAMSPDKRAEGVFHPSSLLDGCQRKFVYEISKTAPSDKVSKNISGELQRIFDVGTWYHIYTQNILSMLGLLEGAEIPVKNKELFINGKADGVFKEEVFGERVVLEIKTMASFIYSRAVFTPFKKHEYQASIYARELGINKILYLYINKDTSEMKEFLRPLHEESLKDADKKIHSTIDHKDKGTLPKRSCDKSLSEQALNCPFRTLCFSTK